MKRYLSVLIVISAITILCFTAGCKKTPAPATCFNTLPDSAWVGQSITFTSCTQGASAYYWVFGDDGFATTATATHIYTAPGVYHGGLTASNGTGDTRSFIITVSRPTELWTFQGMTDTAYYAIGMSGDSIAATNFTSTNISASNIVFVFAALPTANGNYQVINDQFGGRPSATQVAVYVSTPAGKNYGSTGNDNANVAVTVVGGKVHLSVPAVEMVDLALPSDSSSLSASIIQTE